MPRYRLPLLVIPIAALIATLPLILHGSSCGHDFDFHILNWLEAANQFQHGNLHPHWAYSPAWNAGEPRFVFYPPLSWTIGALLGLILPHAVGDWIAAPIVYTWLVLSAAGFGLFYLAKSFTSPQAALLAATFYIVNPYMLFTVYERTAYAELLAAAWIPLLLHAILRRQITIPRIAIPIALLWLTNAPAAVMSCYALALLTLIRIATPPRPVENPEAPPLPGAPSSALLAKDGVSRSSATASARLHLAITSAVGTLFGLALSAFYILPAAYERRFVEIQMAILEDLRPQDNFLFHHTSDALHDTVLRTASTVAVILLCLTALTLIVIRSRNKTAPAKLAARYLLSTLTILAFAIAVLLTPISAPIWRYLPELRFLQFPWRLLAILAPSLSLLIALALSQFKLKALTTAAISLALAATLTYPAYRIFHQSCYPEDTVAARLADFKSHQGSEPTDEYTPTTADNDALAQTDPSFWLASDPTAAAPKSIPGSAPMHLTLNLPTPQALILNLRDYPAWHITDNRALITERLQRDDGLIALPLPAGPANIVITYTTTADQLIGYILTATSFATLILLSRRKRAPRE